MTSQVNGITKEHQELIDKIQRYKLNLVYMTRNRSTLRISEILDDLREIVPEHFIEYEKRMTNK